jgi:predicted lipoprotein with Yx(FWY)xxD motif
MTRFALAPLVLAATLLAACGDAERDAGAGPAATASPTAVATATTPTASRAERDRPARTGRRIRAIESQFGTILADGRRQALYLFDKEERGRSECYGDCARAWPPVLTSGRPVAGKGVRKRLLGTTRRRNGKRQVTYRGRPLYYYVDDAPGRILCHDVFEFGGRWLVVEPDGSPAG